MTEYHLVKRDGTRHAKADEHATVPEHRNNAHQRLHVEHASRASDQNDERSKRLNSF